MDIGVSEDGFRQVLGFFEGAKEDKSRIKYLLFGVMLRPQYRILDLDGNTDDYANKSSIRQWCFNGDNHRLRPSSDIISITALLTGIGQQ